MRATSVNCISALLSMTVSTTKSILYWRIHRSTKRSSVIAIKQKKKCDITSSKFWIWKRKRESEKSRFTFESLHLRSSWSVTAHAKSSMTRKWRNFLKTVILLFFRSMCLKSTVIRSSYSLVNLSLLDNVLYIFVNDNWNAARLKELTKLST